MIQLFFKAFICFGNANMSVLIYSVQVELGNKRWILANCQQELEVRGGEKIKKSSMNWRQRMLDVTFLVFPQSPQGKGLPEAITVFETNKVK